MVEVNLSFQSPYGEVAWETEAREQAEDFDQFPSPCGEVVWETFQLQFQLPAQVSIPLRGSGLGNYAPSNTVNPNTQSVSIPLRGSGLGNNTPDQILQSSSKMFPSPCGEVVWETNISFLR